MGKVACKDISTDIIRENRDSLKEYVKEYGDGTVDTYCKYKIDEHVWLLIPILTDMYSTIDVLYKEGKKQVRMKVSLFLTPEEIIEKALEIKEIAKDIYGK